MISKKYINVAVAILMILSLCLSSVLLLHSDKTISATKEPEYLSSIFNKDSIIDINIEIDETEWQNMLDNAIEETYTSANIIVNGDTYNNVAIRPKGNSSLSQIYRDDSTDRYSFKIKFDKYVDGQTLDGLSKLVLNNVMSDATYMKEYLSYDLLSTMGIATPAYAFANITVNGEPWGLYLAVEPIEEEFIERYYGSLTGNLYKPESDSVAVGDDIGEKDNMDNIDEKFGYFYKNLQTTPPEGPIPQGDMPQRPDSTSAPQGAMNMGGGMNKDSNGSDLVWNGDDISNYSAIFDNSIFSSTTEEDYEKILNMIEHLDSLTDIDQYLNVDEVLRYFAVNTFLVNLDSYASNMKHNYYLYEENGVVEILPWDYNLSFGAFQGGSASNAINFPIDVPVTDSLESSPLIGKLLEVDEYKELYHNYLNEILEKYINNGTYENTINKIDTLISDYVKNDATAFYTYDEYKSSLPHLINYGYDRAKSITAQLEGTQSSTTAGNIETTVDLTVLGQQGGGNAKDGMPNENGGNFTPGQTPTNSVRKGAM